MKKIYSIAGLKVELTGGQTLHRVSSLPGFEIFETNNGNVEALDIDIRISMDENIDVTTLADICPVHRFNVLDTEYLFSRHKEGYLFGMYSPAGGEIVSIVYNIQDNRVLMSSCDCPMSLKFAMWIAYFLPAVGKNIIPIHASSIVKDSKVILFLGESGTGKSTHTRLWMQYIEDSYLLNDDSPLLRIEDSRIAVYGSPWSGKTDCYRQKSAPLKAIVRLRQYPENIMKHCNKLSSIGAIHPSFPPFLVYDTFFSKRILNMIDRIVKDIPVYELKCLPDRHAAEMAYSVLY